MIGMAQVSRRRIIRASVTCRSGRVRTAPTAVSQPLGDPVDSKMIQQVLAHQLAHDLRRILVLARAEILEELLLARINQDGQSGSYGFPWECSWQGQYRRMRWIIM